jgi:CDP-glycerol glycerophosphotransferase (TagB/SpsB family)
LADKIYNEDIEIIESTDSVISIFLKDIGETFQLLLDQYDNYPQMITDYDKEDQLFLKLDLKNRGQLYIYTTNKSLFWIIYNEENAQVLKEYRLFDFTIVEKSELVAIEKVGLASIQISISGSNQSIFVENFLTNEQINFRENIGNIGFRASKEKTVLGKIEYQKQQLIVMYHRQAQEIQVVKLKFDILVSNKDITVNLLSNITVSITLKGVKKSKNINLSKLTKNVPFKIFPKKAFERFKDESLLTLFIVNRTRYYVYLKRFGVYIAKGSPYKVTQFRSELTTLSLGKSFYIFGRMVHHAYNAFGKYDYLYSVDENHQVAKFKRPFRKVRFLKQFGYFKVPASNLDLEDKVHYPLFLGSKDYVLHKFHFIKSAPHSKVYSVKKVGAKVQVLRTNIYNQATYSIVPYSEMYSIRNRVKMKLASVISKVFYKNKKYNTNLYFEKLASKADESGFRVFEKVKENPKWKSENYFILDKNASVYSEMKKKHGKDIVDRFSFRHYLSIFNADYFISSDLSNHVINDRIYINEISNKLKDVPLIFLQHGIMFAKPVENPLGKIFYKNYSAYNVYKNVVNSRLEAKEFYKMGYDDMDLLYTGLATFDYAKLEMSSDKIVYMPTYRYWEEGMIYSGDIEKTTYFRSIIKVIKAFEIAGLRDKLMVVSHNKFADYIYNSMEEYRDVLGPNPSEALKVGRIFISDFSSAIYDAIYRGAYPIFYWEDKDYLIEKYGAVPPVNEENAPGPIATDVTQLVEIARNAMNVNYKFESENMEKYRNINEFHDNKNTQRIVDFMEKEHIL